MLTTIKTMKIISFILTSILFITTSTVSAQYCSQEGRYSNGEFFSSIEIDSLKNSTYGTAVNVLGKSQELFIDFYFPNNTLDTLPKRPFILLVHGGGFVGGNKEFHMTNLCKEFAKRGFVAATISYRLGFDPNILGDHAVAVYRAQQDANAALRYTLENADAFKIDPSWIFMGGSSAGSITSLMTAYGSQKEWNQFFPTLEAKLGPLNSSGNNFKHPFSIKAIFNNWGAVSPIVIKPEELIPMISFHGELDKIVSIDISPYTGFGSRKLHNMLNEQGICNDFTIDPKGGHGIYRTKKGAVFRVDRAACFFKSLFCDTCSNFLSRETVSANCSN